MEQQRIREDDPRLRGHPTGGVTCRNATSWVIRITTQSEEDKQVMIYYRVVSASDYGNDLEVAKRAAFDILFRENENRGLPIRNKCRVLANGDIEMDIGRGYKMIISPHKLDDLIPYHWIAHTNSRDNRVYARGNIDGHMILCHRFLLDAPDELDVDHLNGL